MLVTGVQVPSIAVSPFEQTRPDGSAIAVGAAIIAKTVDAAPAAANNRAVRALAGPATLQVSHFLPLSALTRRDASRR